MTRGANARKARDLAALKAEIGKGLKDIAEGCVKPFGAAHIAKWEKTLPKGRSRSA